MGHRILGAALAWGGGLGEVLLWAGIGGAGAGCPGSATAYKAVCKRNETVLLAGDARVPQRAGQTVPWAPCPSNVNCLQFIEIYEY